jgi:hypothetical protein
MKQNPKKLIIEKRPNFKVAIFGFNQFAETLNGRIAMIAFVIITLIEFIFNVRLTDILFIH